ncbi:MAG: c-type cytochrome [Candidatus Limnocylindrales bacterium]
MNAVSGQLVVGLGLLIVALALGLLAYRRLPVPGADSGPSASFGRARAFAGVALISGLVLTISGIVNNSAPPITYVNPVPDTVASVDAGAVTYDATCARCHGAEYRGDGPDAETTSAPPGSLISGLLVSHSDSDLYAMIRDGLPGGMPGYGASLTEMQRWDLVNLLRGINGQGPSPDVVPASSSRAGPQAIAGFGLAGGASVLLLGWYAAGIRRGRARPGTGRSR